MGQADMMTRRYMADPERFADAFNYAIYGGRHVVDAGELAPLDPVGSAETPGGRRVERRRDGLRLWAAMRDGRAAYALLGVEDQTRPSAAMPARLMLYDAIAYADQVDELARRNRSEGALGPDEWLSGLRGDDRLLPVVTLVVHFGPGPWEGATSLHAMLGECDRGLLSHVPDYRMNLVSPASMEEGDFRRFETELGLVLGYIRYSGDKRGLVDYVRGEARFRSVGAQSVELINALTDSRLEVPRGEERVDMCKAIEDMREDARNEGARENLVRNVRSLMESMGWTGWEALDALRVPEAERAGVIAML